MGKEGGEDAAGRVGESGGGGGGARLSPTFGLGGAAHMCLLSLSLSLGMGPLMAWIIIIIWVGPPLRARLVLSLACTRAA